MRASVDLFCMMAAVMKAGFTVAVTEDVIPEAIAFLYLLGNAERYGNRGK
jgi:hypothetical protein